MSTYRLGERVMAKGCVTRLIDVANREPALVEKLVGFHAGRLAAGYWLLVLKERLAVGDFQFFGYTYMSDGRLGPPSNDPMVEAARPRVHDRLHASLGADGVERLTRSVIASVPLTGPDRWVKIVPVTGHDDAMGPADQYPASPLGIKQMKLVKPKSFLVAGKFDAAGRFEGAGPGAIDGRASYDARQRIARHLATV